MKEVDWHHAPLHRFVPGTVHMITAGTLNKEPVFRHRRALELFQETLLQGYVADSSIPQAWACLSNHYHLIAMAPGDGNLSKTIRKIHTRVGARMNKLDRTPGRRVMYQFWDRCITFDNSYYARLHYVIRNPVKHGLVKDARHYPYCSAAWFERNNRKSFCRRVYSYACDTVNEPDDFEVEWEG